MQKNVVLYQLFVQKSVIFIMKRLIYNDLKKWKQSPTRKPLILNGARQVGKTWLLKEFGKNEYKNVAYINCERVKNLDEIFVDFNISRLLIALSAYSNVDIKKEETLIIIDEIQEYPRALTSLKYFCEDAPQYHIAVAGSLLGISLHKGISFPVGKVESITLYPMTFEEFLMAMGKEKLVELINSGDWQVINSLSSSYIDLLRQYYFVGGMPEVVKAFANDEGLLEIRKIQNQILSDYRNDFSKHSGNDIAKINVIWDNIPRQLAKENRKFTFADIRKGARATDYETAIQWLIDAGLVYKINRTTEPKFPLKFYVEQHIFKLFILDVGLLGAMMEAPAAKILIANNAFTEYKGAFTEQFVLTEMMTLGIPITYYAANNSRIEVDFVVQTENRIIPVEVKAEENVRSKSLRTFIDKYPQLKAVRFSMKPYINQEWMENLPLYAVKNIKLL